MKREKESGTPSPRIEKESNGSRPELPQLEYADVWESSEHQQMRGHDGNGDHGSSAQILEREDKLARAEIEIGFKDATIARLEDRLLASETLVKTQRAELEMIRRSAAFRLVEMFWRLQMKIFPNGSRRRAIYAATVSRLGRNLLRRGGARSAASSEELYALWICRNEPGPERLKEMAAKAQTFTYRPLISIVVPVYRTHPTLLAQTISSVRSQAYANWELCIADDGSDRSEITALLNEYANEDPRIRFTQLPQNLGISRATNAAMSMARGEFVGFLDHDDTLAPDALYRVVEALQGERDTDLIYSDEDKLSVSGKRYDPFFKPDWSPDLLLNYNYVCHFLVVRRELLDSVGGIREGFDGGQDYDLILRLQECTKNILHIPHILYHWRASESSTALTPKAKPEAYAAARRAIADCLARNEICARVEPGMAWGQWRVRYEVLDKPKVSVIMPAGGRVDLLRGSLGSLLGKTKYPNYDVLLVDNSKGSETKEYAAGISAPNFRYVDYRNRPFNFSAINNFAVGQTDGPLVLFLNDDTTIVTSEWLTAMVEHGQRPGVGVVGAKLLYPSGAIQHAGVLMGIYGNAGHAFQHLPGNSKDYFNFPQIIRNCSAVTGACMLTKRTLFLELHGFDEKNLAVSFQDIDYCLKIRRAGYLVVYTPYAVLIHHESASRGRVPDPREVRFMQETWADAIARDPYYNPNLTRNTGDYRLRLE